MPDSGEPIPMTGKERTTNQGGSEKPNDFSGLSFREVTAKGEKLIRQRAIASGDDLARIDGEITQARERRDQLVTEVEQEGGLKGIDRKLGLLRDMLIVGQLSPSHLYEENNLLIQLDNLSGLDSSDPHVGVREWYYSKGLDEITEELRLQLATRLNQNQDLSPRAQERQQRSSPKVTEQPVITPTVFTDEEKEVFGGGEAFSDRWVKARGIPAVVQYYKSRFGTENDEDLDLNGMSPGTFRPSELFSTILETGGRDPRSSRMLSYLLETYPGSSKEKEKFSSSVINGFLSLASLKDALNSGRIDTLAEGLGRGPSPQGIAQWLLFDPETRRSLALILRLQGYKVADEQGVQDRISGLRNGVLPSIGVAFSDHINIRADQIKMYLEKVREAVGTDPGVVRLAYVIFRILGHPHENSKYSQELIKKYMYVGDGEGEQKTFGEEETEVLPQQKGLTPLAMKRFETEGRLPKRWELTPSEMEEFMSQFGEEDGKTEREETVLNEEFPDRDLAPGDIASFVDKFSDPQSKENFRQILEKRGIIGLAVALGHLPAEKIVREWRNYQLILDFMDQISDLRAGRGGASSTTVSQRYNAIVAQKEFNTALSKRILSPDSIARLTDRSKIVFKQGMNEPGKGGWKEFFGDLGWAPKQKKGR